MIFARRQLLQAIAAAVAPSLPRLASAQAYPTHVIKIIVPFPPGASSDTVSRLLADKLAPALGQAVIVENRPGGAGGSVGARAVATADPDGYTLLVTPVDVVGNTMRLANRNLDFDPMKSFAPVALLVTSPFVFNVKAALAVGTLDELAAHARANPGKLSFASPGYGTFPHLLGEMFKLITGTDMIHVPYRGSAAAVNDLLAGQVDMYAIEVGVIRPHIEAGKVKALAVASKTRSPYLPGVPTTIESGFAPLLATYALGLYVPAGTPGPIIDTLNSAANAAQDSSADRAHPARRRISPKGSRRSQRRRPT